MDWISVAEAAHELGVSPRQVRHLVESGALPAHRLGQAWLLPAEAVRARARHAPPPGRPLSAPMAWALLWVVHGLLELPEAADAKEVNELFQAIDDRRVRHRVRRMLADPQPAGRWEHWLAGRAARRRLWVHPGVLGRLAADPRLRPGGGFAAVAQGVGIAVSPPRRFYLDEDVLKSVLADYRAQEDPQGPVEFMIIPSDVPAAVRIPAGRPVPLAVALADLLESDDARERHAAAERLQRLALAGPA